MALSEKQKRFCREYIIDLNATQSAIRAGYSKKTAGQIGEQNLKKLEIQAYLKRLMDGKNAALVASADEVLELITKMARGDEYEECVCEGGIVKKRIVPRDRLKALELMGKRHRLFVEKIETDNSLCIEDLTPLAQLLKGED